MEFMRNTGENEPSTSSHESQRDSPEQYLERLGIFRKIFDVAGPDRYVRAPGTPRETIEDRTPEFHKCLATLLIIGYVLNLIHERGTLVIARNWQN